MSAEKEMSVFEKYEHIYDLAKEIKRQRENGLSVQTCYDPYESAWVCAKGEFDALKAENERLKKQLEIAIMALDKYGDPETWIERNTSNQTWDTRPAEIWDRELIASYHHPGTDWVGTISVGGKTARKALKQIDEIEKERK